MSKKWYILIWLLLVITEVLASQEKSFKLGGRGNHTVF